MRTTDMFVHAKSRNEALERARIHKVQCKKNKKVTEKNLCKELFFDCYFNDKSFMLDNEEIILLDYETPIQEEGNHIDGLGEVDLVGMKINDNNIILYLIEVKQPKKTKYDTNTKNGDTLEVPISEIVRYCEEFQKNKINVEKFLLYYLKEFKEGKYAVESIDFLTFKKVIICCEKHFNRNSKSLYNDNKKQIDFYVLEDYSELVKKVEDRSEEHLINGEYNSLFIDERRPKIRRCKDE